MPFATTNLTLDDTYISDISGSGVDLYGTFKYLINNTVNHEGATIDLSASQYLLIGDGQFSHPNEKVILNGKSEVIVNLELRHKYTFKLIQKTSNLTFYSSAFLNTAIAPLEGTITHIDPFDQAFRVYVSYHTHDILQFEESNIPIKNVTFLLSYRENGGDIFEIQKPVSILNVNGVQKMQDQFILSNLDLSGHVYPGDISGIQNTFSYDINFLATNEIGDGQLSSAYMTINPIDLPDKARVEIADSRLRYDLYFDEKMTLKVFPPFDFIMYQKVDDLSAVHLKASTDQWTREIILTDYELISNDVSFQYTWIDPLFINGTPIEFSASYENKYGQGGITDTVSAYDTKARWADSVTGIPFGIPEGVIFRPVDISLNTLTFSWDPDSNGNNGTNTTIPILYDISLIDATTGSYIPNYFEIDLSTNTKTFTGLELDHPYQAVVVQKNVSPNDSTIIIPSKSVVSTTSIPYNVPMAPILKSPTYHYRASDDTGRGEVTIHWDIPNNNGRIIQTYTVFIKGYTKYGVLFTTTRTVSSAETSAFFSGIPNNREMTVEIYATNIAGNSLKSTQKIRIIVPPQRIDENDIRLIQGDGEITLEFLSSYTDDSSLTLSFFVASYRRKNLDEDFINEKRYTMSYGGISLLFDGLTNGYDYEFKTFIESNTGMKSTPRIVSAYPSGDFTSDVVLFNITRSADGNSILFV